MGTRQSREDALSTNCEQTPVIPTTVREPNKETNSASKKVPKQVQPIPSDVTTLACIVRWSSLIKEEMKTATAKSIADHLHISEKLLSRDQYADIKNCDRRKQTIGTLLKVIMCGNKEMRDAFQDSLNDECQNDEDYSTILEKIQTKKIDDNDFEAFKEINYGDTRKYSKIPKDIQDECEKQFELIQSDDTAVLDLVDILLSRFSISISEYTSIMDSPFGANERIKKLTQFLKQRPVRVYEDLLSVFKNISDGNNDINMSEAAIGPLKRSAPERGSVKRKSTENPSLSKQSAPMPKRRNIGRNTEALIISRARSTADLSAFSAEELGFEFDSAGKGSIIIRFIPKDEDSWNRLKQKCISGTIRDLISVIYKVPMEVGEYHIFLEIWKKTEGEGKPSVAEFRFKSMADITKDRSVPKSTVDRNRLQENYKLLLEELEINDKLLKFLTKNKIVDINIQADIQSEKGRKNKNRIILNKIAEHGDEGYQLLKSYIKKCNPRLYEDMDTNENLHSVDEQFEANQMLSNAEQEEVQQTLSGENQQEEGVFTRTRSKTNELFYAATVVLEVKGIDATSVQQNIKHPFIADAESLKTDAGTKRKKMKSGGPTVKDLLEAKCYFQTGEESEPVTHQLTDTYDELFLDSQIVEGTFGRRDSKRKKKADGVNAD